MSHFPPPPPLPKKVGAFRRVPPAIFPAILGLLGLVAAWDFAAGLAPVVLPLVQIASGMVTALFLFCLVSYAVKVAVRPGAMVEDLRTLPGRTGLAALALCLMVLARLFVGRNEALALLCLAAGLALLFGIAGFVAVHRVRGTDSAGAVTPAMHLVFVGFILAPGAALPLGVVPGLVLGLVAYCALAALIILALTVWPLLTGEGTPPLRPLQGIQLAPPAFIASALMLLGQDALAWVALLWASAVAGVLLLRVRWLTEGGFSGFWSAFTFPATAYVSALLLAYQTYGWDWARILGGLLLVGVTLYIPVIAFRVLKLWAKGVLAAKTNASIA